MGWTEIRAGWSADWQAFADQAHDKWETAVAADPQRYAPNVQATLAELATARRHLDHLDALVASGSSAVRAEDRANLATLTSRYNALAAGVYAYASPAPTGFGVAPAVVAGVIVLGMLVAIAGIIFAVAAYEYCVDLREQTALQDRDAHCGFTLASGCARPSTAAACNRRRCPPRIRRRRCPIRALGSSAGWRCSRAWPASPGS